MKKSTIAGGKQKLGLWGVMASALVLGATMMSSGASMPVKDAQTYACTDSCYFNYRSCLMAGKGQMFCATQYQNCNLQCLFGGAKAPDTTTN